MDDVKGKKAKAGLSTLARQRELVQQAEALLRQKQAEHDTELHMREQLLRRVTMLESMTRADALGQLLQRATLHSQPDTEQAAQQQAEQSSKEAAPSTPFQLEDLPLCPADFHGELLQRTADMTMEDYVRVYRSFVEKTQFALSHVMCHGDQSYMKAGLIDTVTRFSNLLLVHGAIHLRFYGRLLKLNCHTWQEEDAPSGWYKQVAQLIPVHREFAALAQAGLQFSYDSAGRASASQGDPLQQVLHLAQGSEAQVSLHDAELVEALLDRLPRATNSTMVSRHVLGASILSHMLRCFDAVLVGRALSSCWPYSIRMVVFERYLERADVQAVLQA